MEQKKELSAGTVIMHPTASPINILVVKTFSGFWGFPKGHVEQGETKQQAALRETKEEVGLDVTLLDICEKITYPLNKGRTVKEVYFFLAKASASQFCLDHHEIIEARWLPIDAARAQITFSNAKLAFDELLKKYNEMQ